MISLPYSFQSYSHRFVGIDNTSIFGLVFPQYCGRFLRGNLLGFYKALLLASEFLLFYERSSWYAWTPHPLDQWNKYHVIFWHQRSLVSRWSIFALLCFSMQQTHASTFLAIHCRVLRLFVSSLVSPRTMFTRQVAFRSIKWILWRLSMHLIILFLHTRSSSHQYFSPTIHPATYVLFWQRLYTSAE